MAAILIVEDEPGLRGAYEIVLKAHGYEVTTAADGVEGLARLEERVPDLILLDMLMPRMDGLEFMQTADMRQRHPHVKVIAFSNLSDAARLEALKQLGIYGSALKADVNPGELVSLVRTALDG